LSIGTEEHKKEK